jgi:hypothetical protein
MPKRHPHERPLPPTGADTHALGNRKIGDFEPLPVEHIERVQQMTMASRLVAGPETPTESGTWTAGGYVRDVTEGERAELVRKVQEARNNAPRTSTYGKPRSE